MKKFIFKSVLLLIVSTSLLSCSSDDSEPTEPLVCPTGYNGIDCTTQITPTRIVISKIRVKLFPNTNGGNNWDIGSAPDIFVRLGIGDGSASTVVLFTSDYIADAVSDGTNFFDFTPNTPIELLFPTQQHAIILGDYDSTSSNEFMGGLVFNPYNSTGGFPTTITVNNSSIPLRFELTVSYVF
ncbi:hypothetical protein [Flavobacterium aquatile]|uniref:Lipoprotein n=1 Tax=Flavobacterium aquatile LMG 4008 = ATCC 11947 TaxID=1453498 RepID=A0A095SXA1_9FLAO|nr:hypothetical protein [Flavobacterium aquatile]KGD69331.1 hypothetical protein LG45_00685 [Flavobacterium aquatile LMG 4008 = ATCC 11947]OXA66217.1 hypothetical protein B0A61_13190 [Flavobacterium aquatile LMG 4008 = ATCC 11947]GEC77711.1 hypothetical protein FAQ01_05810 [Flavobacterium aquatile]